MADEYRTYETRPDGATEFARYPGGSYNIHYKECFCRVATRDANDNLVLCKEKVSRQNHRPQEYVWYSIEILQQKR